ncbi:deoxyribodipyrimidine photo-lyase [Fusibacter paucivorans]|uniref:Deoxyribodipyrimidine photo-lyase n=1 Tax=Fusibacter paucivorans TaxID=76009 RepID=A0ABS5PSA7_9FIRM|nr:deoxyribodipyrimidine photo-lyase [Fusibacter paucivorans]MBS7528045.1 deoxyribodipyrimidine photo-lyase [Fusibacter paucivorans]
MMIEEGRIKIWKTEGIKNGDRAPLAQSSVSIAALEPVSESNKVVYWMQSAQRTIHNHALAYAIERANAMQLPLTVAFCIMPNFPNANTRHFQFMLEGLSETSAALSAMGCELQWRIGEPAPFIESVCRSAALLVMDDAYLKYERQLKQTVAASVLCEVVQVSTNVVVPVMAAYPKSAYGAYVLRASIHKLMPYYDKPFTLPELLYKTRETAKPIDESLMDLLKCESLPASSRYIGGFSKAMAILMQFIETGIADYADDGNNPDLMRTSGLSPYLHFGQISPVTIIEQLRQTGSYDETFVEQLVVRRELAFNYVYYEPGYDEALELILPKWAMETLIVHIGDTRPYCYSLSDFEDAKTHDSYWNAAQRQLIMEGTVHNYMRMYWGKKIIEWSKTPDEAFQTMLYLNDKYALDGRDPNGYAGIAWCFGKHDRPWQERQIFGKIRYMNDKGLKRKFKMADYVARYHEVTE